MIRAKNFKIFQTFSNILLNPNLSLKHLPKSNSSNIHLSQPISLYSNPSKNYSNINPRDKQNSQDKVKIDKILQSFYAKGSIEKASLTSLKELAKLINKRWLDDNQIRSLFMSFHQQHFQRLLSQTSTNIYELEKLVFLFYWGQIYLEFEKKDQIWNRFTDLLLNSENKSLQDSDTRTIYTYCKTLNFITSISLLQASELKPALNTLYQVFKDKTTFDIFDMRSVIITLNSIMIQPNVTPFISQFKDWLQILRKFDFTNNESIANMALYTLENFKVLFSENPELLREINSSLEKIPLKQYMRVDTKDSNTQRKIASILVDLGFIFTQNQLLGIYSVDFLLKPKLVIDYHGVSHYYLNKQEMIYTHQIKVKVLEKMGYHVQVIPFEKWNLLESRQRQAAYLHELVYEPFYKNEDRY